MKPLPLRAILFDLDGTLLDTAPDFYTALNALRERHQQPPLPYAAIRQTVSNGARALVELGFGLQEHQPGFEALKQELLALYRHHIADASCLFEGMRDVLDFAHQQQLQWGIVTNKPSEFTLPLLERLGLLEECATVICPDHVTQTKPHPEPIYLACRQLGITPQQALYAGDHQRDIRAGRNAGMPTIACGYGYIDPTSPAESWGADHCVNHASELLTIIQHRAEQTACEQP